MAGYNQNWDPTQGPQSWGFRCRLPILPTETEDFEIQLGLINDKALDASGIFFALSRTQAEWMMCHTGPLTKDVSAIPLTASNWATVSVVANQGATATMFYIDGVLAGTIDCSGAGGQYAIGARIVKKAGTTPRVLEIDVCHTDLQNVIRGAWPNPVS
jgi:hypothetical protein